MDPFEDWAKASTSPPCVQRWCDRLVELGASWDSFRREPEQVVKDLVAGNIPLLAARDIVNVTSSFLKRNRCPMAIFWDLENMPIPTAADGRDVVARLKTVLAHLGDLVQFRCYASIGLNLIPQHKRSDLQLSGCHLVDCPHQGRKEVADKMIIVDAMQFAFQNPDGATLCFISGDTDYAYLLAVLQRPQWRTIVISRGTMQSMLHVNCDIKMRWETDILQLQQNTFLPPDHGDEEIHREVKETSAEASSLRAEDVEDEPEDNDQSHQVARVDTGIEQVTADNPSSDIEKGIKTNTGTAAVSGTATHCVAPMDKGSYSFAEATKLQTQARMIEPQQPSTTKSLGPSFHPLSASEVWEDEAAMLRIIVTKNETVKGEGALKSLVGIRLRETNPARFPTREGVRKFFAETIKTGVVLEYGSGAFKRLLVPAGHGPSPTIASLPILKTPPVPLESLQGRIHEAAKSLPYVLFILWSAAPKGTVLPKNIFVQSHDFWGILMFPTNAAAQRAIQAYPWLSCGGTLINWNDTENTVSASQDKSWRSSSPIPLTPEEEVFAVDSTVAMLDMMARNDDVYVHERVLVSQLVRLYPKRCPSFEMATTWLSAAQQKGKVCVFRRKHVWADCVCLDSRYKEANAPFPPHDMDTSKEEDHVEELLWKNNGWLPREDVIQDLKVHFKTMQTAFRRTKVFMNGHKKQRFFFAKGPTAQTVGLTATDAIKALTMKSADVSELQVRDEDLVSPGEDDNHREEDEESEGDQRGGRKEDDSVEASSVEGDDFEHRLHEIVTARLKVG